MIGIIMFIIIVLTSRLAWMQLVNGPQYKKIAEENRIRKIIEPAPRGNIYDRNGALLVTNRPSFAISIIPSEYTNARNATPILANIIGLSPAEIEKMLKDGEEFIYTPIRIKLDVDQVMVAKIQEHKYYLPGVIIEAIPVRHYVYRELAAHLFGFVGRINEAEYTTRKNQGYNPNDFIGKDGLEREWEEVIRGVDGGLQVEVNALGEEIQIIGDKPAMAGQGLVLTLDANLQKITQDALAEQIAFSRTIGEPAKGGSAVVLDVRTGAVLAMASEPGFDPNIFASGISSLNWNKLINDPYHPLANKTIQNTYPPGSVFKIVTAAAALDMGDVTATEEFDDKGVYVLNGWYFYGWETKGLGRLTLVDAICWSSDPVFYELGDRIGIDNLASYALTFGFGQTTGIKLAGEEKGIVPTQSWKQSTYGEEWYPGETIIAAIGQGYYLVTPLQQAMVLMAMANNGIIYRPMLVDKVLTADGAIIEKYTPEVLRTVYLKSETWDVIKKGLVAVTNKGTAAAVFQGFSPQVAGKTGSAETGTGTVHAWFSCYAPADNPEIVVSVLVEEGGDGSVSAAPVVRKILEGYFGTRK